MNEPDGAWQAVSDELDWSRLESYLRARLHEVGGAGLDGPLEVVRFTGGRANLTYLVTIGSTAVVVRRPPFGDLAPGAHDMGREYKALSRLWRRYDRAPRALLFCEDPGVLGQKFFVMEHRRGVVVRDHLPESLQAGPDAGRRIGLAVVDALADLHAVDPASCGLGDLGRPDGFVARQLSGWSKRWELVATEGTEVMDRARTELERTQPSTQAVAILHNDMKPDNCQFEAGRPDRVHTVFDWDMATLGDPLVDVGTLLNYWPDPSDRPDDRGLYPDGLERIGLPAHADLVAHYAQRSVADLAAIGWYQAFACWKTAVVLRQMEVRYLAGKGGDGEVAERARRIPSLAARALEILGRTPFRGAAR